MDSRGDNSKNSLPMNRILIIAHTPLASALKSAALHVFPDAVSRVDVMDVMPLATPDETLSAAQRILKRTLQAQAPVVGTLIMSDVFGATPCNVAQRLADGVQVKCVAGASLPMLLRAITYWDLPLSVMAEKAVSGGSQGAMELG